MDLDSGGGDINLEILFIAPILHGHQFLYSLGGWFVFPLFMVQVWNVSARKIMILLCKEINEIFYFIMSMALGIAGVFLSMKGYNLGWYLVLVRTLYFIPFYGLGILYKNKLEDKISKVPDMIYFSVIISVQLVIITIFGRQLSYTPSWCSDFNEGVFMPYIVGCLGIAFWLRICERLMLILKDNKYIKLISENTYSIMMNQFLGFMLVKWFFCLISSLSSYCADFDFAEYKNNIWYYYLPHGISNWGIVYLLAGIVVPILIQLGINQIQLTVSRIIKGKK